ncbi:hypothetical protein evm_006871 [Chilo suppressalis]|nr:hypothetical protein evm_006871 [Chilo suppressalis]
MEALQDSISNLQHLFTQRMDAYQCELQAATPSANINSLRDDFVAFRAFILTALRSLQQQMSFLACQVDTLEIRSRRRMLLCHGVAEEKDEDTEALVARVVNQMKVSDFNVKDISRSHRMGRTPGTDKPRPILFELRDYGMRDKIWYAKKVLKGSGITISEFLTKTRHEAFMAARAKFGIGRCFIQHGIIIVVGADGKRVRITSAVELDKIPVPVTQSADPVKNPVPVGQNTGTTKEPTVATRGKRAAAVSKKIPIIPNNFPFQFKRTQFPVSVCYAMTINKAQGQTFRVVGVDLGNVSRDWRAHAAILLANPSSRPEHDRRTLTQLGDTLSAKGLIYSAQFCYISAGVPFSPHPLAPFQPPSPSPVSVPRLCLLLADHKAPTFQQFATDEAIFATEIYEYALSLNQDYVIKEFLLYKLVLATRFTDAGLYERALAYCEQACRLTLCQPPPALLRALANMSIELRYSDGMSAEEGLGEEAGEGVDSSPRHHWLDDVTAALQTQAQLSPQHHAPGYYAPTPVAATHSWTDQSQQYQQPAATYTEPAAADTAPDYGQYYQNQDYPQPPDPEYDTQAQHYQEPAQQSQEYGQQSQDYGQQSQDYGQQSQDYVQQSQVYGQDQAPTDGYGYDDRSYADNYWQGSTEHYGYGEAGAGAGAEAGQPRPMITMPGTNSNAASPYDYDDDRPPSADSERETDTPKTAAKKAEAKKNDAAGKQEGGKKSGWLGGILTRLSLRPPNQMILPDDRNPTIVWDPEHKRWRNLDGDEDEPAPPPPPPRAGPAPPSGPALPPGPALQVGTSPQAGVPPSTAPTSNIFKMQKSRREFTTSFIMFSHPLITHFDLLPTVPPGEEAFYGGSVSLADYCPYLQEFTWKHKSVLVRGSRCSYEENTPKTDVNFALENYGQNSKCFDHSDKVWEQKSCRQIREWQHWGSGCYKYKCESGRLHIIVSFKVNFDY